MSLATLAPAPRAPVLVESFYDALGPLGSNGSGFFAQGNTGTGAGASGVAGEAGHPGIFRQTTGTTATGQTNFGTLLTAFLTADGTLTVEAMARLTQLSTGAQQFFQEVGFFNNSAGAITEGAYFRYNEARNGGRYEFVVERNNVEVITDTGILAAAGAWVKFRVQIAPDGLGVNAWLNGVAIANVAPFPSVIPSGIGASHNTRKTVGLTAVTIDLDYFYFSHLMRTAR